MLFRFSNKGVTKWNLKTIFHNIDISILTIYIYINININEGLNMYTFSLDIETIPNPAMEALLPEPDVKLGNVKDPKKIEEKRIEAKEKQLNSMALKAETGMIASFSMSGDIEKSAVLQEVSYSNEIELINEIFLSLSTDVVTLITFNGMDFDLPFIYKRAMINGIDLTQFNGLLPLSYWMKRYTVEPHCDIMKVWSNWSNDIKGCSLDYLGSLLLGERKTDRDYSQYLEYIQTGKSDIVLADNVCDSQLTMRLYNKMNKYLF